MPFESGPLDVSRAWLVGWLVGRSPYTGRFHESQFNFSSYSWSSADSSCGKSIQYYSPRQVSWKIITISSITYHNIYIYTHTHIYIIFVGIIIILNTIIRGCNSIWKSAISFLFPTIRRHPLPARDKFRNSVGDIQVCGSLSFPTSWNSSACCTALLPTRFSLRTSFGLNSIWWRRGWPVAMLTEKLNGR